MYILGCFFFIFLLIFYASRIKPSAKRELDPDSLLTDSIKPKYDLVTSNKYGVKTYYKDARIVHKERPRTFTDKDLAIMWAREVLAHKSSYVILDTETTGLNKNDVVVQLGVIDMAGSVLIDTLIKPTIRKRMNPEVTAIHGITMKMLADAPTLYEMQLAVQSQLGNRMVLIYNAEYDARLLNQSCEQDRIPYFRFNAECVMLQYSKYVGDWNDYHKSYRYQRLPSGDHSAIGDCQATLKVIEKMAATESINLPRIEQEV